jgi:hypothetical protein
VVLGAPGSSLAESRILVYVEVIACPYDMMRLCQRALKEDSTMTPWEFKATEVSACNCAYGCPCQFNALPTYGNCEAMVGMQFHEGHFGDVRLDGLRAVSIMHWPGAVHEGGGKCFVIIDENADEAQRQALLTILSGDETEMGATIFNVFAATYEKVFDPVFKPIDMAVDVDARVGHVKVEGICESSGQPILNPVTGDEHRVRIDLPGGFEYTLAEIGSSTFSTSGPITLSHEERYAQFAHVHMNNQGVVRSAAA